MNEKLRSHEVIKALMTKSIAVLFIAVLALVMLSVLTNSKDGRKQIVDEDGGTEYTSSAVVEENKDYTEEERRLSGILGSIKGVGAVTVMAGEKGVIITAEGAESAAIRDKITAAVSALFGIPASSVKVFEKE